jgi:hypothetical protein
MQQAASVQTQVVHSSEVVYHAEKWDELSLNNDLEHMQLHEYYLGKAAPDYDDNKEQEMLNEMFADAVDIGAINFPKPYEKDDFELKIERLSSNSRSLRIVLKRCPSLKTFHSQMIIGLNSNHEISSPRVHQFFRRVLRGLNELLDYDT